MPRPKYRITADDYLHASAYLAARVRRYDLECLEEASGDPEKTYAQATDHRKKKVEKVSALNAWCEKYLPTEEWTKLKLAIRKRRERSERYHELTTITISVKAHGYLVKVSKRDSVTFSEALEHYLAKAWRSSPRGRAKGKGK